LLKMTVDKMGDEEFIPSRLFVYKDSAEKHRIFVLLKRTKRKLDKHLLQVA